MSAELHKSEAQQHETQVDSKAQQAPAPREPNPCDLAARQAELSREADRRMWDAMLGGDGSLRPTISRVNGSRNPNRRALVCAKDLKGREDLRAGEPYWNSNNFAVRVSDEDGRFATITLVNIKSMSRGELQRRAVALAREGKSSNLG